MDLLGRPNTVSQAVLDLPHFRRYSFQTHLIIFLIYIFLILKIFIFIRKEKNKSGWSLQRSRV